MMEKDFFISTVNLIDIDGHTNIPTVLYYREGKPPLFGPFATQEETARFNLNEDFKLDLGNIDPSKISPKEIEIIYTLVTRLELSKLHTEIDKIDQEAFVVMHSIKDAKGGMIKKRPMA